MIELTGNYEEGSWQDTYRSMGCCIPYWDDDEHVDCDIEDIISAEDDFDILPTERVRGLVTADVAPEPDIICPEAIPVEILVPGFKTSSFGRC